MIGLYSGFKGERTIQVCRHSLSSSERFSEVALILHELAVAVKAKGDRASGKLFVVSISVSKNRNGAEIVRGILVALEFAALQIGGRSKTALWAVAVNE